MARRNYSFDLTGGRNSSGKKPDAMVVQLIMLAIGLFVLLPIFPPFGLIWCLIIGKGLFENLKKEGVVKQNVEGKFNVDWNRAKSTGRKTADDFRAYSKDAAVKFKTRVSESDRMEERQPYRHPHTPMNYSYDKCAQDRRLEQLKSLKDAGILEEKEYQQRRAKIMAGK